MASNVLTKTWIMGALLLVLISSGCRSSKETERSRNIENRKTEEIMALMEAQELECSWLSLKYDIAISTSKIDDSFKMYVRLRKDSAIWVSATYYAVEIARFLFTPDSVKFMDRRNNQYYIGDYSYIGDRFEVEANYEILQAIIMGNSLKLLEAESEDEKVRSSKANGSYFLTLLRKRQMRRALRNEELAEQLDLNVSVWVDPVSFRADQTRIDDFEGGRSITASYSDYQKTCNSSFPYQMEILAESVNEQAKVKTSVMKLTSDKKVSLSFTIPEKYEALVP